MTGLSRRVAAYDGRLSGVQGLSVDFYVVGSDPFESLNDLVADQNDRLYPGQVSAPVGSMLRDLEVFTQSTKIAIDSNGVITYRAGYGQGGPK